ncbi:MAG: hypothetical protein ACE10K_03550, partial [Rhodothermales bacterium]
MGFNGLAKEFKKHWGKDKTPDANEAAPDAQSERASVAGGDAGGTPQHWNEDAQDPISDLLDAVSDEAEDEAIDLAAIRQALAEQEPAPVAEDASEAQEDDLYLVIDEILSPEAPPAETPPPEPPPALSLVTETEGAPEAETSAATPKAAAMEPLFKDVVVLEMLEQGTVSLSQALMAIRRQAEEPEQAFWRILADLPTVDRKRIFEQAANLLGFETIDIEEKFSVEFIRTIVERLPPRLRDLLFTFKVLPLKLKADPQTRQQSLLLATPDPSHPALQPILEGFGIPVELYFAPEDVVARYLEQVLALFDEKEASYDQGHANDEAAPVDLTRVSDETVPAAEAAPKAEDDQGSVNEILDLTEEDTDFLELHWEPFAEEEPSADAEPPAATAAPTEAGTDEVQWK